MKAAIYDRAGSPDVLRHIDVADPKVGPDDVLIEVRAISIEGGDLINRRNAPPPTPYYVVGYAASGTIIEVGENVATRKVGDRVASFDAQGSHASLRAVPAGQTWLMPQGISWEAAAALPISFGTAHHCLFARGSLRSSERVFINAGAGGVGLAAVQLAKKAGATVLTASSGSARLEKLAAIGADHVVDHRETDVMEFILERTDGKGADLVVDPVGSTLQSSLGALAPEGRLVFVGNAGGGLLTVELWSAMQSNQSLFGVFMGTQFLRRPVSVTVDRMLVDVAEGTLKVHIARTFALADAADAHRHAEQASPFGRVVLSP